MREGLARENAALVASVHAPHARLPPPGTDVQTGAEIQRYWQATRSPVDPNSWPTGNTIAVLDEGVSCRG